MLISCQTEIAMTDFHSQLAQMHRPRLLIHAARLGLSDYRRDRDLRRLGGLNAAQVVPHLLAAERAVEGARQSGAAGYSISHHFDLLIALMAVIKSQPRKDV
jgi:hypothetical protein